MVRNFHFKKRFLSRINRHYFKNQIPDKIVVENSKISYAQYFIIPSIFTFVGIQFYKQSNYNPVSLVLVLLGGLFGFGLNVFLTRKFRKNPEIVLNNKGITFSKTRTIFWKEILSYRLHEKNSTLKVYVKCDNEEFFLEFKNLPISKVKLKVLINSFYRKYCSRNQRIHKVLVQDLFQVEEFDINKYFGNTIL